MAQFNRMNDLYSKLKTQIMNKKLNPFNTEAHSFVSFNKFFSYEKKFIRAANYLLKKKAKKNSQ